jgi:hypothetical protein
MWDRVLDLARRCAPVFRPVRYQSMDIAITPDGPVLVEGNRFPCAKLSQVPSGQPLGQTPLIRCIVDHLRASYAG